MQPFTHHVSVSFSLPVGSLESRGYVVDMTVQKFAHPKSGRPTSTGCLLGQWDEKSNSVEVICPLREKFDNGSDKKSLREAEVETRRQMP
jgi:hypothetical protein